MDSLCPGGPTAGGRWLWPERCRGSRVRLLPENLSFDHHSAESPCYLLVVLLNDQDIVTIKQ